MSDVDTVIVGRVAVGVVGGLEITAVSPLLTRETCNTTVSLA